MEREIELTVLDLRYESYRMKNPALEARLLASIAERGIEEPLEGVDRASRSILLNGFKRYRCAVKLGIGRAPYTSLGEEEVTAILNLLRVSNDRSLSILEQAAFLDQLRQIEQMSVAEIAEQLSRSKAWVSMRLGLIAEMSPAVREKIFRGDFPVYPYMYTLRQFMRMNGVGKPAVEEFVVAVSVTGHNLWPRVSRAIFGSFSQIRFGLRQEGTGGWAREWDRILTGVGSRGYPRHEMEVSTGG